jgi:hypothetical protein
MAKKIPFKQCVCAEYTNTPLATEAIMNEALERIFGEYYSSKELPAINWEEFKRGFKEELEHGCRGPVTNITCNSSLTVQQAVAYTQAAWAFGFGYAWQEQVEYVTLPTWLSQYVSSLGKYFGLVE